MTGKDWSIVILLHYLKCTVIPNHPLIVSLHKCKKQLEELKNKFMKEMNHNMKIYGECEAQQVVRKKAKLNRYQKNK